MNHRLRPALALVFAALVLAGCGFQPLLGRQSPDNAVVDELAAIRIASIPDRAGQLLRNELLDSLTPRGTAVPARYTLVVRLQEPRQTIALRRDDIISRSSYSAVASFELTDRDGRKIAAGNSSYSTDYEITVSEYATRMSLEDARARVLGIVAADIRNQLALSLSRVRAPGG